MLNLDYNEAKLLTMALKYEAGHSRRTRHLSSVYAVSNSLGSMYGLGQEALYVLKAAAILHDLPIKLCKEKYLGDASQSRQRQEAPEMVKDFLKRAHYPRGFYPEVTELVLRHHCYDEIDSPLLQLLIEADLLVNLMEETTPELLELAENVISSEAGKTLLKSIANGGVKH